ncbi:hypothetical protein G6F66_015668 [Rhizopus arrhizus]|nr:hypothetical protein G6F66_015668 [Rhizopus arrhizus]
MAFQPVARIDADGRPGDPGPPGAQPPRAHPALAMPGGPALQAVERGGEDFVGQEEGDLPAVAQRRRQEAGQQGAVQQMARVQ